ncbi:BapA/Bap/LapF family large adhesin [Brenneria tiliae]|uniref:BapA/Bap/LapF family large adhesin n=1 Tax=Brenneria tiliae TaxID=2914984 RepID=UPI002014AD67|nr:BapA/Bap/LapF family large adhesin [Brenneria tiliae]MCL2898747.1 Ig-like domain-containing protein [Brenneria tiliae]MCL2903316.1 Ig-like domain-containing protein [Brenneria tiliae]
MSNFSITAKENGATSMVNTSSGELNLSSPSIVTLQADRQEIASMTRSGNDLMVTFHSGEKTVLKNFYIAGEHGASELVLEDENGALWWVKDPATQPQFEFISAIDEITAGAGGAEAAGGTALPYILGGIAGVATVAAMASDRHDDDDSERDAHALDAPTVNISEDGSAISGEAEPGGKVTITDADGNTLSSATVGDDGRFTAPLPPSLTNGETISVVVSDAAGNTSAATTVSAPDSTPPSEPTDLSVAEDGSAVSGSADAGSTVTITDAAGNELGRVAVGEDGNFTVPLSTALTNGEAINAVASDAAGNISATVILNALDITAPSAPADLLVTEDGDAVSGRAEAGGMVTVTDTAGNVLGRATVGEDGRFTVPLSPALTNGEVISAVVSDAAGNASAGISVTAPDATAPDNTAPSAPADLLVAEDGSAVSGSAEVGSTVTITDTAGNVLGNVTVGNDGRFTIPLSPAQTNGEAISVVVSDAAGNASEVTSVTAPDTTAPSTPADLLVAADGAAVSGNAEAGSTVKITDAAGNELGGVTVGDNGSFTVPLSPALTNGETINVVVSDAAGNASVAATTTAPDTTVPSAPTDMLVAADGAAISGNAEAGSTVKITDAAGNELGSATVGNDGSFTVPLSPALTNGEAITVTASDATGNASVAATVTAPDTTVPSAPADLLVAADGAAISGTAEAGSTVKITDAVGNELGSVTADNDGRFTVPLSPALTNGEAINVVVSDAAGNASAATSITAPDTTAPSAPTDLLVAADGSTVSGTAESGSTVKITDTAGNELGSVTVGNDGSFTVPLSPALTNGEAISAVVSDVAGNASAAVTAVASDTTAPSAPTDLLVAEDGGAISGSAEAGSTVKITDAAGNVLGSVTVGDNGSFTVPLSPALTNGEAITVIDSDTAGNTSAAVTATAPDITAPSAPADLLVAADGTAVSGSADVGSTVTITDAAGNELGRVTVGEDGHFTVPLSPTMTNGEAINAVVSDAAGNASAATSVTAPDTTAPTAPADLLMAEDGTAVSGNAETGSTVKITDAVGNELGSVTVGNDGRFTVPLSPALTNGETVSVVVSDAAGNASAATSITAPDTTAPSAPTDLLIAADGTAVSGTAEAGSTVKITDADGNELGSVTVGNDGHFTVPLLPALTNGEAISAVVSDAAGNASAAATATASDTTAPSTPADLLVAEDGAAVSGSAEAGSTVKITDTAGNELGSATVGNDGHFAVPLSPALTNGEAISVVVSDAAGNASAAASVTAPDITSPAAPADLLVAEDGAAVSGRAEPDSTVTITDTAGNTLGSATVGNDGHFTVPLSSAQTNGEAISAVVSDATGNASAAVTAIAPDTTSPSAPADLLVAADGSAVSGSAEAGSTLKITDAAGNELGGATVGDDGHFTVPLSPALTNGEAISVVVSDAAGNVSVTATTTAPDTTAPSAPTDLLMETDGAAVSGTVETGSTVTITDAAGNVLGSTTAGDDGSFTVPLSPALINGEAISVVVSDTAGNTSAAVSVTAPDNTAPVAPGDLLVAADGASISGTAEAGSTVKITDAAGNELDRATVGDDGHFTVPVAPALINGETVMVTVTDAASNISTPTTATAPDLTAPSAPVDLLVAEDGSAISGNAEAGSKVKITGTAGNELGSATVGDDGHFTVPLSPALTNGETITATTSDTAGNASAAATAVAPDTTAPSTPADLLVAADGSAVSGNAEAGSMVKITDAAGNELGSATVGNDGHFTVPLSSAQTNGETITATTSDTAGNASAAATAVAPDTTAPSTPADLLVAEDGTAVSGNTEAGSKVTITDAAGNALGEVTVDDDGHFTVPLAPALTNGETVTVTVTDAASNISTPTTATAPDLTAPSAPVDLLVAEDGAAVSGSAEAGSTVTITDAAGNALGNVTVGDDGSFTVPLLPALTNGEAITVVASDAAGNASTIVTAVAPDTTAPSTPADLLVAADGSAVSGTAEAGSTLKITDAAGSELGSTTVGDDGHFTVQLSPALTNGEAINVVASDAAGNASAAVTTVAPDTTAPSTPADLLVTADGTAVSGSAEAGSTVTITDAAGNVLSNVTVGDDGHFTVPLSPAQTNGEAISVVVSDAAGNASAAAGVTAPDTTAPAAPADLLVTEDGASVSGTAEVGSTVKITDAAGNELGSATVGNDGRFTVPLSPALTNGEAINVVASDAAGNASTAATATAPDATAPEAPEAYISDDGTTVNGTAEAGSTVTVTLPDNSTQTATAAENGTWSITLPQGLTAGEQLAVTATDGAGNTSSAAQVTVPDTSVPDTTEPDAPEAAVSDDGLTVSGTAEPESTVTVTLPDSSTLTTTADAFGVYSVTLPTALINGETVTVTATDAANNISASTAAIAPDLTAPAVPTDLQVSADGASISGTVEAGSKVSITDATGNALGEVTVGDDGHFTVPLSPALTNGEAINVVASDAAGNASTAATSTAPDTTAPSTPADLLVAADGSAVSGNAEAGSMVKITDAAGNELGSATVGDDGHFTVPLAPALTNGEAINVVASDAAGNASTAATSTAPDTTAPSTPAELLVVADGTAVSGTAEAGSTVKITDAAGNELGSATVGNDGRFTVPLSPSLTNGEAITATASDTAGNASTAATATAPDATAPEAPEAYISDDGTTVNGTAEAGSTVTVTLPDNSTQTATAAENGTWSITLPQGLTAGEQLAVTATDGAGNTSSAAQVTVPDTSVPDTTAPEAPEAAVSSDGLTVSGTAEPQSTVTVTLPDSSTLTTTADAFGVYSVTLPTALINGETVTVTATDAANNISASTAAIAPDLTAPAVPTDLLVAVDGAAVSGTTEAGSRVTITDAAGNALGSATAGDDGRFTVPLSPALTNGEAITATASDAAGNASASATVTAPDTTAPDAPSAAVSDDGGSISGVAESGSSVTITLADGSVATVQANAQGNYSYDFPSAQANGQSVSVTAADAAGNISAATNVIAPVLELAANDNNVSLELATDAEVSTQSYSDWGVLVVGALGNIASLLGNDSAQVTFTVDNGATADVVLEANATGGVLSLLNSMGMLVQQYNADTDSWTTVIDTADAQWASLLTIGNNGVTLNVENMNEGTYRALAYNTALLSVGSYVSVAATVTQTAAGVVNGETLHTGNVITDEDLNHGTDVAPAGTVVTQVAHGAGEAVSVTADGAAIQGEYGTLSINQDGGYTYTLTDTSTAVLGHTDSFTYTVTANGETSTARLVVSLGTEPGASGNVVAVDDSAAITYATTVDEIDNGASSQSGFTVLNLGLGSVMNVGILDDITNPIIFDVEEGVTRTMTLQASVGGVSLLSGFDLYIYKFNDATQQYDQYRTVENWLTAPLLGGSSDELTLTLDGGKYLFLLDTAYGVSALTRYTLHILEDHIYTVETVSASASGSVMEDDIAPTGSSISAVNGVAIAADGVTSVTGEYGVLTIDAQGHYTYTLNAGVGADGITAPDSFVYTLTSPDGESDNGTLNINLVASPLTAVDDSVTLAATAVQEETSYSDGDAGSTAWRSSLLGSTSESASGTVTVAEHTLVKDASITFKVDSLLSLGSLSIGWTLLNSDGTELANGTVGSGTLLGSSATVSLGDLTLDAGEYTLNFTGSIGALSVGSVTVSASVAGTNILLDDFQTESAAVEGNIFDGSGSQESAADQLVSVATTLSIADVDGNITTLNPYVTSDAAATVQGRYGVLTLNIDGEYSYTLNGDVDLTAITEKESFNYTLTSASGETAAATLTVDLALQLNGTSHGDIATGSVYDDTFALGGGGDTVIFNLLDAQDATGGNGSDTWTDFSLADGDQIDVSRLLQGGSDAAGNVGDWLSVETVNGNTVISIDRDGQGTAFSPTELVTLQGVEVTLDELLENHAITA